MLDMMVSEISERKLYVTKDTFAATIAIAVSIVLIDIVLIQRSFRWTFSICNLPYFILSRLTQKKMYSNISPSAFETVGFETMTGMIPGAFVIASKCTIPIRPIPITPTLTVFAASLVSTFIERVLLVVLVVVDRVRNELVPVPVKENAVAP